MNTELKTDHIYIGHVLDILRGMPSASVDCLVTSPPYWSQRNYDTPPQLWDNGDGTTWRGELGQEPNFKHFVKHLIQVFAEAKRVMKPTGTVWVNLADSYGGSGHGGFKDAVSGEIGGKNRNLADKDNPSGDLQRSNYNKSLLCITDRFKIAMVDELGFKCRNDVIWHKPNQVPQSATDRLTSDYENLFFFSLENKYNFNQQFEPYLTPLNRWGGEKIDAAEYSKDESVLGKQFTKENRNIRPNDYGRNMRSVWSINTEASGVPHFATFPDELPKRCIMSAS